MSLNRSALNRSFARRDTRLGGRVLATSAWLTDFAAGLAVLFRSRPVSDPGSRRQSRCSRCSTTPHPHRHRARHRLDGLRARHPLHHRGRRDRRPARSHPRHVGPGPGLALGQTPRTRTRPDPQPRPATSTGNPRDESTSPPTNLRANGAGAQRLSRRRSRRPSFSGP